MATIKSNVISALKWLSCLLFILFIQSAVAGPNALIQGKVTATDGSALPGVTVTVKGTNIGTATNAQGEYSIDAAADAILVFSSVGYTSQEVAVAGRSTINITLQAAERRLDEVVVIGYGTASKRDLTGSVAKVKGETLAAQPNTNPLASLQSKVSGLQIVNNAVPGSTPDVRIRGTISIGSVNPVYIVDGIFSNNMDFVNPSEIESIEILKDPSSLAVFGIKGAAGAIIVTTKKARAGQVNINLNTSFGVKQLVDKIELANADQFRQLASFEAQDRLNDDPSAAALYNFMNNVGTPGISAFTGNTDWIDAVTRTAKFSTTNLSLDAASDKNRFHMGIGYAYDEGLVKHVRYDRATINLNNEYKINNIWKVGFTMIGSKERLPYQSGALEAARRALPIISSDPKSFYTQNPYGLDSGNYMLYSTVPIIQNSESNPLAELETRWDKRKDDKYRIVGSAYVDINITKNLNFRPTWYTNMSWQNYREYSPLMNMYDPTRPDGQQVFARNNLTAVSQYLTNESSFQQDYIATYKKSAGDHNFNFTGGFTTFYQKYEGLGGTVSQAEPGKNMIPNNDRFWYINTGFGDVRSILPTAQTEYATVSGLARLLYNYKNKYYFNASFRRDGASQINREYSKKWQNFWALGAAWELTKEAFMADQKAFNYLKLKASHGLLGNFNPLGKAYPAYPSISTSASAVFGDKLVPVYTPDYLYDPNLHWETVKSTEVGLEGNSFGNRLHFDMAYYYKQTNDLLVMLRPSGILPTLTNGGSIENKGFELAADWTERINDKMRYTIGANFSTYKNKILSMRYPLNTTISTSEQTASQAEAGYPIGYFYGLVVDGIYQSYADILASPVNTINGGNVKPGDLKYKDIDGNGVINDKDRTMIGDPTPDFTYGITGGLTYGNFEFNVDLAGSYGAEIYRVWGTSEQKNSLYNYPAYYTEGWTGAGTSNWVPIVNQFHLVNRAPSTLGIEDGSFFRIRNIGVAYNFAKTGIKAIKNAKLALNIQNLKTWKNNMGYSPEFAGSATFYGVDYGNASSAIPRVTTLTLNVNF